MNINSTHPRPRFWVEVSASTFFAIVTVLTLAVPDWIEEISAFRPDSGDGSAEWAFVALVGGATLAFAWLASREWRRGLVAPAAR
ncbi:MAG TPA: hypothetical protein VIM01_09160 [Dermatophilaceae bacterium]